MKGTKTLLFTLAVGLMTISCDTNKNELSEPQSAIPLEKVSAKSEGPGQISIGKVLNRALRLLLSVCAELIGAQGDILPRLGGVSHRHMLADGRGGHGC